MRAKTSEISMTKVPKLCYTYVNLRPRIFYATPCLGMPPCLSSPQITPSQQRRGRGFNRKQRSEREMLREKARDWRLPHCDVSVNWTRSLTLKWGIWGEEQIQDLLCEENETEISSQKFKTDWWFRTEPLLEYMWYDNYVTLPAMRGWQAVRVNQY